MKTDNGSFHTLLVFYPPPHLSKHAGNWDYKGVIRKDFALSYSVNSSIAGMYLLMGTTEETVKWFCSKTIQSRDISP